MNAVKLGEQVSLIFSTVLDAVHRGLEGDDEEVHEVADRAYWERLGSKNSLAMADQLLEIIKKIDPSLRDEVQQILHWPREERAAE